MSRTKSGTTSKKAAKSQGETKPPYYERLARLAELLCATKPGSDEPKFTDAQASDASAMALATVRRYRKLVHESSMPKADLAAMSGRAFYDALNTARRGAPKKLRPDLVMVHARTWDARRNCPREGVSLKGLHHQLTAKKSEAEKAAFIKYPQLTRLVRRHRETSEVELRLDHAPGKMAQVDFSGKGCFYIADGVAVPAALFVAVLPYSSYMFACCTNGQTTEDILDSFEKMGEYFGGFPEGFLSDNWPSGVVEAGPVPKFTRPYLDFFHHHGVVPFATRPRSPRHKGSVENSVRISQDALILPLEDDPSFSLEELNQKITQLIDERNARPFSQKGRTGSRATEFAVEREALSPLAARKERGTWGALQTVPPYAKVYCEGNRYSVPYDLVKAQVKTWTSRNLVRIYREGRVVAEHKRIPATGRPKNVTNLEHVPEAHRYVLEHMNLPSVTAWGEEVGPAMTDLLAKMLDIDTPLLMQADALDIRNAARGMEPAAIEAAAARTVRSRRLNAQGFREALARQRDEPSEPEEEQVLRMRLDLKPPSVGKKARP